MYGGVEGASLFGYDGLGQLVANTAGDRDEPNEDSLHVDAHGNVRMRFANRLSGFAGAEQLDSSSYYSTGRLRKRWGTHFIEGRTDGSGIYAVAPVIDSLDIYYDFSGNVSYQRQIKTKWLGDSTNGHAIRNNGDGGHSWTWYFYDADQRLRVTQRTFWDGSPKTDFEEYWYDALGRRVAVRSRADSSCSASGPSQPNRCYQPFVRTVWDGDQVLYENRGVGGWQYKDAQVGSSGSGPWYGNARYTQTGAVDAPILLWLNNGEPRVLHCNWRGNVAGGTMVAGDTADTETVWPAAYGDIWLAPDAMQQAPEPNKWLGSLVTSSKDVTGTLYRRNRYYDPVSGRFTQEDPIGLAGGMNLYGYAAGDPINNSDPFGLKVDLGGLNKSQADRIRALRRSSTQFRQWYDAIDRLEGFTLTVFNPGAQHVARVQGNGDGETFKFGNVGGMMLSTDGNWASDSEFESVVAHEFAHAAAGVSRGTPSECYDPQGGTKQEECAVQEQNKVHRQIGLRDRSSYSDVGPFKQSTEKKPE